MTLGAMACEFMICVVREKNKNHLKLMRDGGGRRRVREGWRDEKGRKRPVGLGIGAGR
jgi:hypothetical protein